MTGLTGIIKFDHQGFRSDFVLDIIELNSKEGLKKIGTWNSTKGINFTRSYGDVYTQIVENLQNKTFIVTTILVSDTLKMRAAFLRTRQSTYQVTAWDIRIICWNRNLRIQIWIFNVSTSSFRAATILNADLMQDNV